MNGYTSINTVLNNVKEHPLLKNLTLEQVVRHTSDFIQLIGMPQILEHKTVDIPIDEYKGDLPCDYYSIEQVKMTNDCNKEVYLKKDLSTFGTKECAYPTYKVVGRKIWTSFEKGNVTIAYSAIAVDKNGYPLLPNDIYFIKALQAYIKNFYFGILYDTGEVNQSQRLYAEQDYLWCLARCTNYLSMMTPEDMANIRYMFEQVLPHHHAEKTGYSINNESITLNIH